MADTRARSIAVVERTRLPADESNQFSPWNAPQANQFHMRLRPIGKREMQQASSYSLHCASLVTIREF